MALRRRSQVLLLLVVLASGVAALAHAGDKPARDGVLVHLSHGADQPHRALMPLKMATIMADDHDVLVYLDIEAVNLALKEAPAVEMPPHFPSSRSLLTTLLDKGVTVMVCPTCLEVAGRVEADLLPGVRLADKGTFFSFTKGRIVTLDY